MRYDAMAERLRVALLHFARDCDKEFACNVDADGVCDDGERLTLAGAFEVVAGMLQDEGVTTPGDLLSPMNLLCEDCCASCGHEIDAHNLRDSTGADACLTAAAPEMLSALRGLVEAVAPAVGGLTLEDWAIEPVAAADAAIAKATRKEVTP